MSEYVLVSEEEKPSRFQQAQELMKDGDYEEACDIFEKLAKSFPDDRGIWWQYLSALNRARLTDKADEYTEWCYRAFPGDLGFTLAWMRGFDARADWDESIRRRYEILAQHDPRTDPDYLPVITEFFLPLVEKKDFNAIRTLLNQYWNILTRNDECGAATYFALEAIGDFHRQLELCDIFLKRCDPADPVVHGVNYANLRVMVQSALWNQEILSRRHSHTKVVSFGQNCLPYSMSNRWGLLKYIGNPDNITIFDLGAFSRNSAPEALLSDFEGFRNPENYYESRDAVGAPQMMHKPTGVHFGHERGRTIIGNDQEKFFSLINKKIDAFQNMWNEGRCLLVYSVTGQCDLPELVRSMEKALEEKSSRLLILNCTRQAMDCPSSQFVTYTHTPFPFDYHWNEITNFTKDVGLAFDARIMAAIKQEIDRMDRS
ncbi:hypothetical protein A0U92_09020 [Acetobacter aceti]|uniref:Tetratricopeptide repeat protein n=1 Tax=Acetobacter aceti TaxID=435 RepID=A0A1U9KGF8_ACEAC|nr:hypothetical protein A0U92_09020 [Acetobacter aceti]